MSWKVRHEGSPRPVEGLELTEVAVGLQEGRWEPTDEVMGPDETQWVPLESHPQFAELASDLEPAPPRHEEDESRLDMNPLIDVCLVLLIFFMLTTSYLALQKSLPYPAQDRKEGIRQLTAKDVEQFTIPVTAKLEGGATVIRVGDKVVPIKELAAALTKARGNSGKQELLLDVDDDVIWDVQIGIQNAAAEAGIHKIILVAKPGR